MVAAGALLGVGAHLVNVLPDLADDAATGVRGLPHRLGARRSSALAAAVLVGATVVIVLGAPVEPAVAVVALVVVGGFAVVALVTEGRTPFRAAIAMALVDVAMLVWARMSADVTDWDLIVVGAGPAGTSTALSALHADPRLRVLLLDRADFPRDKSCGDGIAPHVFDRLSRIGVSGVEDGWTPLTRLELARGSSSVARTMARPVYVIPREVFDARLVERAVAAGAALRPAPGRRGPSHRPGGRARRAVPRPGRGRRRRRAQRPPRSTSGMPDGRRALAIRGYAPTPPDRQGTQVIRYGDRRQPSYAWAFDRGDGLSNVGYGELLPDDRTDDPPNRALLLDQLDRLLPGSVEAGDQWKAHHLPLSTWRWDQPDGPVLLAGDAAGLINPMTGEGIYYAVATGIAAGRAAAQAYRADNPARAGELHRRAVRAAAGPAPQAHLGRGPAVRERDRRRGRHPGGPAGRPDLRRAGRARPRRRPHLAAAGRAPGRWGGPTYRSTQPRRPAREGALMQILSVRGALPPHRYPQAEITDAFALVHRPAQPRRAADAPVPRQRRGGVPQHRAAAGGLRRASSRSPRPTTCSSSTPSSSARGRSRTRSRPRT